MMALWLVGMALRRDVFDDRYKYEELISISAYYPCHKMMKYIFIIHCYNNMIWHYNNKETKKIAVGLSWITNLDWDKFINSS